MKLHPEEWQAFEAFREAEEAHFPALSGDQKKRLLNRAAELKRWQQEHPTVHNVLTMGVVVFNVSLLLTLGFVLPSVFDLSLLSQFAVAIIYGLVNYGLTVFSLHEVNGHNQGIRGDSFLLRSMDAIVRGACRLNHADPEFYKTQHYSHHNMVGTKDDKAFTNAISLKRFLISIIPFAVATPFCDYKIHTDDKWTKSKAISEVLATSLLVAIVATLWIRQSWLHGMIFVVVAPWSSFFFDRLRETSEHNFMPNIKGSEARSFGLSFWGLIVGGGPWGQCCHLVHHIAPTLPWYFQIALQRDLENTLTEDQRKIFLRGGMVEYLVLWKEILGKQRLYFR